MHPYLFFLFFLHFLEYVCEKPGCSKVLVIDGNMKTCRQVCMVKDITTMCFKTIEDQFKIGNKIEILHKINIIYGL